MNRKHLTIGGSKWTNVIRPESWDYLIATKNRSHPGTWHIRTPIDSLWIEPS